MRKILFGLLVIMCIGAKAQVYNNEWIDYTKTYYKFRVGKDGVYRISGGSLSAAGLGAASAQDFQLWRNGVQVPLYTSVTSGALGAGDYIEFWGKMNDGKPDRELYRDSSYQPNDKWSLISDSSAYFLTINPAGPNLRLQTAANNVAGNVLPAEPYFMYTAAQNFKDKINSGLYWVVSPDRLFSSSYDQGEGWSSPDIETTNRVLNQTPAYGTYNTNYFSNLYPAASGPAPTLKIAVGGNAYVSRSYKLTINGDSVAGNLVPYMYQLEEQKQFNLSLLNSGNAAIAITNQSEPCTVEPCVTIDRMVVHKLEINYPRQFNFGGAYQFEFTLPASATGNYLEISNFSHGGVAPVLYDLTNNKRYVGELSGAIVKLVLPSSGTAGNFILVSQVLSGISSVSSFSPRTFVNYNLAANQGDYLIISNPLLFNGAGGTNPIEDYRAYRASVQGGAYNAKICLEEQLTDQFGFGIKKNPAGVRNFLRFARNKFSVAPKQAFIIGRGVHYLDQRSIDAAGGPVQKDNLEKLNLVPTFGWPASDILLAAEPGTSSPATSIGRLTAITPAEVSGYLKKVKDLELAQQTLSPSIGDKLWMKNIAHIEGAGEEPLASFLASNLNNYKRIIEDTLWGAKVSTFSKTTSNFVQQLSDVDLTNLFNKGMSLVTYYGHSSPTTLEFNLDDPANYNNQGKYPMFFALGCNAGNTFDYNETRFTLRNYLSDKYVLAPERGSINFVASTHFGIVHYLDIWNIRAYANMASNQYRRSIGEVIKKTINDVFAAGFTDDFLARCNAEETILNGDPAVGFNEQAKPDYAITDTMVKVAPNFISVADQSFKVDISLVNLGKAINRKTVVETKRQYPNGTVAVVRRDTLSGTRYRDTLSFNLPIEPIRDKGANKIFVTVDADNVVDELFETNNSTFREFFIYEDEARPIYPQNYGIVTNRNITLKVSSANPFSSSKQYRMEMDTTELFNSPLKVTSTITSSGGLMEFSPGISFTDSTVYYWRVAPVPAAGSPTWSNASFVYLANSASGFNQSHYFQQAKSLGSNITLSPQTRTWQYDSLTNNLTVRSGVFGSAAVQEAELTVSINGSNYIRSACAGNTLVFNIIDPNTFVPRINLTQAYGSDPICATSRQWNFAFDFTTPANRKKIMDFMDSIPDHYFVVVRNILINGGQNNYTAPVWKSDEAIYGAGNSLYHKLVNAGFSGMDSITTPRVFSFIYQKNTSYAPSYKLTNNNLDLLLHSVNMNSPDSVGTIVSPVFGPAQTWKQLIWKGNALEAAEGDNPVISILGVRTDGTEDILRSNIDLSQQVYDISSINAQTYPSLKLSMRNTDNVHFTPYQLRHWRLTADLAPEGGVAPNILYSMKDTVDVGEPLSFKLAFKNISDGVFQDSMKLRVIVYDRTNTPRTIPVAKQKSPKNPGDVLNIQLDIDTKQIVGANTLFVDINPDNDQPEQLHFNNFTFRNFYVRGDTLNPLMDVTFDNVHILNRDIVSSKPSVLIKLKDEAKWMLLNDPSVTTVQVRYPDNSGGLSSNSVTRTFSFSPDTLRFIPATGAPNANNAASIEFKPFFERDGEYELIVTGKDMSNNTAGAMSYRVNFQVINKPMISNMLNYPNPFTTSTAFVFTLTGSEVPQNIKIQILTVTGKIIREITKDELGPLRIGRNITEYKWDGTDQYGQKLGNGVYLYRVVTNLNGRSLDKYTSDQDNTDKYFNKGYGKMYLMR